MPLDRRMQASLLSLVGAALVLGLAAAALMADPGGAAGKRTSPPPQVPATAEPAPLATPFVQDTPANLQAAFTAEVNAKEHYTEYARQADREGFPQVARLFRACAEAEQVHSRRHLKAIAYTATGASAKAVLERVQIGSTAENLRAAIENERFEATQYYPALLARARADHQPMAVRSINLALAAEREHAALLEAALEGLDRQVGAAVIYVCPFCGKTVVSRDFKKCPNCFTSSARFIKVT